MIPCGEDEEAIGLLAVTEETNTNFTKGITGRTNTWLNGTIYDLQCIVQTLEQCLKLME